jgi:transposase
VGIKLEKVKLLPESELEALSRDELVELAKTWRSSLEIYQGLYFKARKKLFGKSSEKSSSSSTPDSSSQDTPGDAGQTPPAEDAKPKPRGDTKKSPSGRYPDATIIEDNIDLPSPPCCPACGEGMNDSGMTEDSEYLTTTPKEFIIVRQKRVKHRCGKCHGAIVTAPPPARIIPGGTYGDELIVDVTLSKYCDLTPIERYCEMAARSGFPGLPSNSLIATTMKLAAFLSGVYELIRKEVLETPVLYADETTHRMLEGDEKSRWFLWGFSSSTACFFECHDTRSGDVSTAILKESKCIVLMRDAYTGYGKSVRIANQEREARGNELILSAYCNAHARREFKLPEEISNLDAEWVIDQYKKIYKLEDEAKVLDGPEKLRKRSEMRPIFESIKDEALKKVEQYSNQSQMAKAYKYFLKYYDGLTLFLDNPLISIDNNGSERLLRSHVVGRKTWYGTHSKRGAYTAAIHFTIVESCKLNKVNPRDFYLDAVERIHTNQQILTPYQFKHQRPPNSE